MKAILVIAACGMLFCTASAVSTSDHCRTLSDCNTCLLDPLCGWCGQTGACDPGNSSGPSVGTCPTWEFRRCDPSSSTPAPSSSGGLPPQLAIQGNKLVTKQGGSPVFLGGVNSPGAVFPCVGGYNTGHGLGYAVFDHNITDKVLRAIKAWDAKIIRFGMNEDCVLGINGINPLYSGENYLHPIREAMEKILGAGLYLILELHWTAPGTTLSNTQYAMPDSHSPKVWTTVVREVLNKSSVPTEGRVFLDVFQEPFPNNNEEGHDDATWKCWRDGARSGSCIGWDASDWVGMSDLVSAVRSAGSKHQILLGGVNYANGLYKFVEYAQGIDPLNQVFASFHNYKGNACANVQCWNDTIATVAKTYPVLNGEVGETDCQSTFLESWTAWLDSHNENVGGPSVVASLAWIFDDYNNCEGGPSLVTSVDQGTCTPGYGCWWKDWLLRNSNTTTRV